MKEKNIYNIRTYLLSERDDVDDANIERIDVEGT
jgi:hypothetical protein